MAAALEGCFTFSARPLNPIGNLSGDKPTRSSRSSWTPFWMSWWNQSTMNRCLTPRLITGTFEE